MNAKLLVVMGKTTKREVKLKLPTVLGRSREADITVAHPLISRRHVEISEVDGLLMLRDMASLNGTMIGGRRVETAPLLPNAEFTIGPLTFRVVYEYDGDLESVPDTVFIEEAQEATEADLDEPLLAAEEAEGEPEFDEALPAEPLSEIGSNEMDIPDLLALADVDPDEALPAPPVAKPGKPAKPAKATRPAAHDNAPTVPLGGAAIGGGLEEPLDVDPSLQSGGHGKESPWSAEPEIVEKQPKPAAKPAAKSAAKPAAKPKPKNESDGDFGNFLEGLE